MYLKLVNRKGHVPHEAFTLESGYIRQRRVQVEPGATVEEFVPSIENTTYPFEDGVPEPSDEYEWWLLLHVDGKLGFDILAGRQMILFQMNEDGKTIDKTVV